MLIDRSQLEQVLMNIIINARDAMREGGTLTVSSSTRVVSDREARRTACPPGTLWKSVADTGNGIPQEVRERIFEPFFTTKQGKGTGMGLATVYGIVEGAAGWVDFDSTEGSGTTFRE